MFTSGRTWNPPPRFDLSVIDWDEEPPQARLEITLDRTRSILSHVDAPDLDFNWSLNPYRGCTHACAYCYAREFHEFLELGAGTDFERRISVKLDAPELLREVFERRSWTGEVIAFSGATDCYQPLEKRYELTRRCLEVCAEYRNPVAVITRSPLIVRDLDLLQRLNAHGAVKVSFSIPLVERATCRAIEPGTASPAARLRAMAALSEAGIPVGVSVMPLIPGLNDHTVPATLQAAREAGARWAWTGLVRLPGSVAQVFEQRLREALPDRADHVMNRLKRMRGGPLDGRTFRTRTEGSGADWQAIEDLFRLWHRRLGYESAPPLVAPSSFRRPGQGVQLSLL